MTDSDSFAGGAGTERKTLSRDLADFLIEFSIAINKYAMYPGGHPSLGPAAERVVSSLQSLMVDRESLSLGVARHQLVIEGVATDPKNPVLGDLAGRLHRHELGAITFRRGLAPAEMQNALAVIAQEADRLEKPLGESLDELPQWSNVKLYPLTYEKLDLMDDEGADDDEDVKGARTRAAQLWVGLARAAAAEDAEKAAGAEHGDDDVDTDPNAVAKAIERHKDSSAYDQVIVGYMLQIADELRGGGGRETLELQRRISNMVSSLNDETVGRLLEMGGDSVQRRKFLLNASQGMSLDAVVELVQAAGRTHESTISHSLMRMLQKMSHQAEGARGQQRSLAEENARAQIEALIGGWALSDPNPESYRMALERMAGKESVLKISPEQRYRPEPKRIVQMALEVDETGEQLWNAIKQLGEGGEFGWVLSTIREAKGKKVLHEFWEQFGTVEQVEAIASAEPLDTEVLEPIVAKMGTQAVPPLLAVLTVSESAQTRRFLLDRIAKFGPQVSAEVIELLGDERWYVVRNMLCIMGEWDEIPGEFEGRQYLKYPDPRVRREALKVLLKSSAAEREHALSQAISDEDPSIARTGLAAALEGGCPDRVIPVVATKAKSAPTAELRTLAIKVLGGSELLMARKALINLVPLRRRFFRLRLPQKSPELVAAIGALREVTDDADAKRIIELARKSKDADVARAAGGSS